MKPYRVVQWATGNIGSRSLRSVIEHRAMRLVGLYVHSEAKHGRDAGEFCGLEPVGVKATRSIDDILALEADCVLYMQQGCNFDDICRLLASGKNIVTTRTEFNNPASLDPAVRQRIEEACAQGGTSLHATGASPGFITEALPLVLTSLHRRLDSFRISEFANLAPRNSPEMLFQIMGFGQAPDPRRDAGRAHHLREAFAPSLQLVAEALGLSFDSVEAYGEVALASHRTEIAAGVVEAGTVAAQRTTVSGMRRGKPLMSFNANWFCTTDIDADWKLRSDGWRLEADGDVPLEVDIRFPVSAERWPLVSPGLTAHRAVNAVPYVCAAAPGIRTTVDLPQIISDLGEAAA
ncbi:MAG TPA: hypothetical protein VLI06_05120 [Solimonas sp.]|nr:hypothetical protein [Solimonas sp.]